MKKITTASIIIFCIVLSTLTNAMSAGKVQAHPDALQILNLLAYGGVGQMKFLIGGEPGGEDANLNDFNWQTAYIGYQWEEENSNVWFRTVINVPENISGFSLAYRNMTPYSAGGVPFLGMG